MLLQQTRSIQRRMEEIHSLKRSIEAETQSDCDSIISRLSADENLKISLLQNDVNSLLREITVVDRYMKYLPSITPLAAININVSGDEKRDVTPKQMIEFLSKYNDILDYAQNTIKKPFKTAIEIEASFVRELQIRNQQLSKLNGLEKEILVKDQIIYKLMKERNEMTIDKVNKEVEKVTNESRKEMEEWSHLAERLATQLERYKMKCKFCDLLLTPENVNLDCSGQKHYFTPITD